MNNWAKIALLLMVITLAAVWLGIGFELIARWNAPLGPALELPTLNPASPTLLPVSSTPVSLADAEISIFPTASLPVIPTRTPDPTQTAVARCVGPARMILLAIGSDTRADGYMYGLADVIRLVRVDFTNPGITVLEFPRDLWVQIPDISEHHDITHEKLNQAYLYGNSGFGYYDGPGLGPGLLARTLDLNFGARPDYYAAINMQTFVRLVDALGGIDINLPYNVDGRRSDQQSRNDLYFRAGPSHLQGQQALILARLRVGTNADRSTHQSLIACALRDAALQPSNITRLPEIVKAFEDAVQTDLSPQAISALLCLAPQIPPQNIRFVSFPPEAMTASRTYDPIFKKQVFVYEPNLDLMRLYTVAFQNGDWPPPIAALPVSETPSANQESFTCP